MKIQILMVIRILFLVYIIIILILEESLLISKMYVDTIGQHFECVDDLGEKIANKLWFYILIIIIIIIKILYD